jgi:hypothetical protein
MEAHPQAHQLGEPEENQLPWTFIVNVDANNRMTFASGRSLF